MRQDRTLNPEHALLYLTECTLATVCRLAGLKSSSKCEYRRQIAIAQVGIDMIQKFGIKTDDRVREVVHTYNGKVEEWAKQFEVTK